MFKNDKLKHKRIICIDPRTGEKEIDKNDEILGYCQFNGCMERLFAPVREENIIIEIDGNNYYYAEVKTQDYETDYHTYDQLHIYNGVFLAFDLPFSKFLTDNEKEDLIYQIENIINDCKSINKQGDVFVKIDSNGNMVVNIRYENLCEYILECCNKILELINSFSYTNKNNEKKYELKK